LGPWLGLVQERPSRELNAKLQLTPEQEHVLDMRCLLNVLSRLAHELNLLTLGAKDVVVLKSALTKLQGFRQALGQPPPRLDLFGQFTRFEAEVFSQLADLWQEHPELAGKLRSACEDNLRVLFEVLRERAQEFMARVSNPLGWKALSLAQVRALLSYPLEAAGSNSLAQYRPRYNELEQPPEDYLVEIVIRSRETDRIQIPLLLQDVMRELSAFAYEQTPPGGRIRMRLEEERRRLTLQVSDGGQGLTLETLKRLAEYGPDEPALLKAYSVSRQLGGHMSLCSRPGAGIDVILEIPTPSAPRA
ncbi:MAG: ATP-binding protein, partial [Candidatus Sericytochromatia bacterium]